MQLRNWVQQENDASDDEEYLADENNENTSSNEGASTATSDTSSIAKLTKIEQRERKRAMKLQRSVNKAAKNEARHVIRITAEDVERIGLILHGDDPEIETHPLATDKTIEDVITRNLGFVKQIRCHKRALYDTIRTGRKEAQDRRRSKRRISQGAEDIETERVIDAILAKLDINVADAEYTRKCKSPVKAKGTLCKQDSRKGSHSEKDKIVNKLREAIKEDLEKHENDLRQTYIRAGGFFRYAGKTVFERMTAIATEIDLRTGEEWEKKRKRETKLVLEERGAEVAHDHDE